MLKISSLLFIVVFVHARKESYSDLDKLLNDPNIWQYIEKRVGHQDGAPRDDQVDDGDSALPKNNIPDKNQNEDNRYHTKTSERVSLSDSSGSTCSFEQNTSLIIRSKASMNNGAFFLKNSFDLTAKECAKKCCYTQNCNLAVYEDKEQHSCYLFDCGSPSKCLFAHHANYSIMAFQNHDYLPQKHQKYHENELESLGKTPSPIPTTTTNIAETPTPFPARVKVPLFGDCERDWGKQCADRNSECRDRQCICKPGYHGIYGVCRETCSDDEFQCTNKGLGNNVPNCIDSKHRCDGIPQCADGSDEDKCPMESEDNKDLSDKEEQLNKQEVSTLKPPEPIVPETDQSDKEEANENEDKTELTEETESETENNQAEKDEKEEQDTEEKVTKTTTTTVSETPKITKTTMKSIDVEGPDKVIIKSPSDSNQGPIVALALGLGICLMLLIFVGCRLRTVKRRIRRGKSLHSNEADYLINGMYL